MVPELALTPITPKLGAEVHGLDLAALTPTDLAGLRAAFARYRVLVFRDQCLDQAAHKAFGRHWGVLQTHPAKTELGFPGDPEIFDIKIDADTRVANGECWHTDLSCEPVPPSASALYITETPASGGGDTMFANMTEAFTSLSRPVQDLLLGLEAVHSGEQDLRAYGIRLRPGQRYPEATHPVVIRHPQTGEPVLYVNEAFTEAIVGLSKRESDALLQMLFRHIEAQTRIQCRIRWTPNTLVLWDNLGVHHHAVWDYYPERRLGERVTAKAAAPPAPWRSAEPGRRMAIHEQVLTAANTAELMDAYGAWAPRYEQDLTGDYGYVAPQLLVGLLRKAGLRPSSTVLDAGCGTGLVGVELAAAGCQQIDGLDYSTAMLEEADHKGVYRQLSQADLNAPLALPTGTYDAVSCVGTFTNAHVGQAALGELLRVTRPGGLIGFTARDPWWSESGFAEAVARLAQDGRWALCLQEEVDYIRSEGARCIAAVYRVLG